MKHARNISPAKATRAPVHAKPCVVVYYYPQGIHWCVERFFLTRRDGSKALTAGQEVCRVSSWLVAVNVARRYAERHGVPLITVGGR